MSALADRPEEDNNDDNSKDNNKVIPSFISSDSINSLPIEKQFSQRIFVNQIQTINLKQAKELLEQLHLLFLSQQHVVSKITKEEFLGML